eukprot:980205_1
MCLMKWISSDYLILSQIQYGLSIATHPCLHEYEYILSYNLSIDHLDATIDTHSRALSTLHWQSSNAIHHTKIYKNISAITWQSSMDSNEDDIEYKDDRLSNVECITMNRSMNSMHLQQVSQQ